MQPSAGAIGGGHDNGGGRRSPGSELPQPRDEDERSDRNRCRTAPFGRLEVRDFTVGSLAKRLRAAGIPPEPVEAVRERALGLYQQLWSEYEDIHGVPHPARAFEAQAATAR